MARKSPTKTGTNKEFEKNKLRYGQALESMRHIQRVEAIEMGFVVAAYGILIAGLLGAPAWFSKRAGFWALFFLPVPMAMVWFVHFCVRRSGYFDRWYDLRECAEALDLPGVKQPRKWFGFIMRLAVIASLALSGLLAAEALSDKRLTLHVICLLFAMVIALALTVVMAAVGDVRRARSREGSERAGGGR